MWTPKKLLGFTTFILRVIIGKLYPNQGVLNKVFSVCIQIFTKDAIPLFFIQS